jgi:hypothetical protein
MSEIVKNVLESKKERIVTLAAFATNQFALARGEFKFEPQEDAKAAKFEAALNDPYSPFHGSWKKAEIVSAMYALEGKEVVFRDAAFLPVSSFEYGVVVVPTPPVLGVLPDVYGKDENSYVLGQPYFVVNSWSKRVSTYGGATARGKSNATIARLNDVPLLPARTDMTRPATDDEIRTVVNDLVDLRGVSFVEDVLQNLEERYAHLLG